jgi:hypothetical protein
MVSAEKQFPVLLVTGARQVGKTTFLRHAARDARTYVTLDDPLALDLAVRDPALFLQRFPPPALIDEIQYAPGLLPHIKMVVDGSETPGQFWLTGSQHFHLMKGISESLAAVWASFSSGALEEGAGQTACRVTSLSSHYLDHRGHDSRNGWTHAEGALPNHLAWLLSSCCLAR